MGPVWPWCDSMEIAMLKCWSLLACDPSNLSGWGAGHWRKLTYQLGTNRSNSGCQLGICQSWHGDGPWYHQSLVIRTGFIKYKGCIHIPAIIHWKRLVNELHVPSKQMRSNANLYPNKTLWKLLLVVSQCNFTDGNDHRYLRQHPENGLCSWGFPVHG